ncbi:MAG: hypothetical protein CVU47_07705 [Chloroflexi bacterium HGW-Chloroflexi-9]|nr:MAG: hypothetical protein CVU47_07705 [Chloroflexi bacterium HGW-Chloroflexi-9]
MICVPRARLVLPTALAGLALLLGACGGDEGGLSDEEAEAIRATIDPVAWALTLVLPDADTVEVQTGTRPAAFHTVEYDPAGRLVVAAVDKDAATIATFNLVFGEADAIRATGARILGRFAVTTTVGAGDLPEAKASALDLAALVNAQRVIDLDYTPPGTPASLEVGLNLVDAFEAAGREWLAALEAGEPLAPRVLATCEETRDIERSLWMFIARPCVDYGRAAALVAAGDLPAATEAIRAALDRTASVTAAMRAGIE